MTMTDEQFLQAIGEIMDRKLERKLNPILSEMAEMKSEMAEMKSEMEEMKSEMTEMKSEMAEMKAEITSINLHLENQTDKNIQLLAENHGTLIDKLNEAIPAHGKTTLMEIQVRTLTDRVEKLEKAMKNIA